MFYFSRWRFPVLFWFMFLPLFSYLLHGIRGLSYRGMANSPNYSCLDNQIPGQVATGKDVDRF